MKKYKPKGLIPGYKLGLDPKSTWIAVPNKFDGEPVAVEYNGTVKIINDWKSEAQMFKRFSDKFGGAGTGRPSHYTLGYFRFNEGSVGSQNNAGEDLDTNEYDGPFQEQIFDLEPLTKPKEIDRSKWS